MLKPQWRKMTKKIEPSKNKEVSVAVLSKEARQKMVWKLRTRGFTLERTAEVLNIGRKTVERDEKEIQEKRHEWFDKIRNKFDPVKYWEQQISELKLIKEELWAIHAEGDNRDRVKALEAIESMQKSIDDRMRRAGIRTSDADPEEFADQSIRIFVDETIQKLYGNKKKNK